MSDTNEQPRPQAPNGGRQRTRKQGESYRVRVDQEEQRGKAGRRNARPFAARFRALPAFH